MAATATSQTLFDGERVAIMKFDFTTTDSSGETGVVKVNPASLLPSNSGGGACDAVSILKVSALTSGMSVAMYWQANTPLMIETIPSNTQYYSNIGGLTNNAGSGKTGNITFTTYETGAGDAYTVILEMQKHYVNPYA
jgi:hypothetical protein